MPDALAAPPERRSVDAATVARLAFVALVVLRLALELLIHYQSVFDRVDVDYGEGPLLAAAERLREEPPGPRWLSQAPYTLSCYGPAYYWTVLGAERLVGDRASLTPGRLVNFLVLAALIALVGTAVGLRTRCPEGGLFAALMLLMALPVGAWGTFHKPDLPAVLATTAAVLAAPARRWGAVAAAALIVAGSLFKQAAAGGAAAIVVFYLCSGRRRDALGFAAVGTALGAAAWGTVIARSQGYWFEAAVGLNLTRWSAEGAWRLTSRALRDLPSVLALTALAAAWYRGLRAADSLPAIAYAWSLALHALLSGKEGANINYFLEPAALGALTLGIHGVAPLRAFDARKTAILLLLLTLATYLPGFYPTRRVLGGARIPEVQTLLLTHLEPGEPVLADGRWMEAVLRAGARPAINDNFLYRVAVERGRIDPAPLVAALREGHVRTVIFDRPLAEHEAQIGSFHEGWPPVLLRAIADRFTTGTVADGLVIYRFTGDAATTAVMPEVPGTAPLGR